MEDPSAPSLLTPVSELDRRQDCIEKIVPDHPLMQLLSQCLHNSPAHRPSVVEVCQQVGDHAAHHHELAAQQPPNFANKIELLHHLKGVTEERNSLNKESCRLQEVWRRSLQQVQTTLEAKKKQYEAAVNTIKLQNTMLTENSTAKSLRTDDQRAARMRDNFKAHSDLQRRHDC